MRASTASEVDCGLMLTRLTPQRLATASFSPVVVSGRPGLIGKFGHIEPFGTGAEDGEKAFGLRIVENGRCAAAYVDGG